MKQTAPSISDCQAELCRHPGLQGLIQVTPAVDELSHDWHDYLHFKALDRSTGQEVIIKVGVSPAERYWTVALSRDGQDIVPRVFGDGEISGPDGRPLEFIAMERLPHTLIGEQWGASKTGLLLDAAARFQFAARDIAPRFLTRLLLEDILQRFHNAQRCSLPGDWRTVVQNAERDFSWLEENFVFEVCHGDVHVGNAFSRNPPPIGPALLIDINPLLQPWVFDSTWVEACAWQDTAEKGVLYTVWELATRRRKLGLELLAEDVVGKAGRIALSWHAIQNWTSDYLDFMPGFKEATGAFIDSGASVAR